MRQTLILIAALALTPALAGAQTIGTCEPATAVVSLDINNVNATIYNNGGLFWRGGSAVYEVPKGGGASAIFASGIWLAGFVGTELRAAGTRYGSWEFWAGPLDDGGNPPGDCSVYNRLYRVTKAQIEEYNFSGATTTDLADWPTGLGAPTLDADGNPIDVMSEPLASRRDRKINLAAGERPAMVGDQMIWWVMNDMGNTHGSTGATNIGAEVHGLAFAFNVDGPMGNTTVYKYRVFYKGNVPLTQSYFGIFSDPDLGDAADDYVGSDTTLGVGYVYNSDNFDGGSSGYGEAPPATGYDFFQGPIVPSVGDTAQVSGVFVRDFKNLALSAFVYYNNGGGPTDDPSTGPDYYNYMRGVWKDGEPITFGGNGRGGTVPTKFMFPGDPATGIGWSEVNSDGANTANVPADRRFVLSTGPFTINPGDSQEIVFGIVTGFGADNLDSVTKMKQDDATAQKAYDAQFILPEPPAAPEVTITAYPKAVLLEWQYGPRSNNYLNAYTAFDPFTGGIFAYEGVKVFQYSGPEDLTGRLIATYDINNGIKDVVDNGGDGLTFYSARGTDSGLQNHHFQEGLVNAQKYYFGIQSYAYSKDALPKVFNSNVVRVEAVAGESRIVMSPDALALLKEGGSYDFTGEKEEGTLGDPVLGIEVTNAQTLSDATYRVAFYKVAAASGRQAITSDPAEDADMVPMMGKSLNRTSEPAFKSEDVTSYDLTKTTPDGTTTVLIDGTNGAPLAQNVYATDGLQISVTDSPPGIKHFTVTSNAAGPLDPPDIGNFAFNSNGFPTYLGRDRPDGSRQQTNGSTWGINVGGSANGRWDDGCGFNCGGAYIGRSIRETWVTVGIDNFEFNFTAECAATIDGVVTEDDCVGWRAFDDGGVTEIPFEAWNRGPSDDPSDDFRLVPAICESACGAGNEDYVFDIGNDHPVSGGANDPYTDWVYIWNPEDNGATPGEAGYEAFFWGTGDIGDRTFSRQVFVNWNGGVDPGPYDADLPESGTTFKITTLKPAQVGDRLSFNTATANISPTALDDDGKKALLDKAAIVPNPYMGNSAYENNQLISQARFTNLPEQATIRVFSLSGALIRTLTKNSSDTVLSWDMTTENRLPISSGIYLIHVDAPGIGTKVLKFAVINRRLQMDFF